MDWGLVQGPVRRELAQVDRQLVRLFRSPIAIVNAVGLHFLSTRGKKFRIRFDRKLPYEVDGGARKPVRDLRIKVHPGSIAVCVPSAAANGQPGS